MNKDRCLKILLLMLTAVLIIADQLTKSYIVRNYELYTGISLINGFLSFFHVRNTGSAFSFLSDKSWGIYVLTAFSTILAVIVLFYFIKALKIGEYLPAAALCLLFSGAVGNLIDRFRLHYVVDFIRFDFGEYTFPIFNIADICAVLGTIMLIAVMLFLPKRAERLW